MRLKLITPENRDKKTFREAVHLHRYDSGEYKAVRAKDCSYGGCSCLQHAQTPVDENSVCLEFEVTE